MCAVVYSVITLKKDIEYRKEIGFPTFRGNVDFDTKRIITITSVSVLAGAVAAVVGIGGGMIYIPMLLIIGYPPFVASSTSMLMVMYAAASNFISYTIGGHTNIGYGFWLALWTVLGVVVGVTGANKIVKKTGRQSIFIILLAGVLIIGIVFCIIFNTLDTKKDIEDGENIFELGDLCK